jgi:hypothetical protein
MSDTGLCHVAVQKVKSFQAYPLDAGTEMSPASSAGAYQLIDSIGTEGSPEERQKLPAAGTAQGQSAAQSADDKNQADANVDDAADHANALLLK